jgi:hypothetical protein
MSAVEETGAEEREAGMDQQTEATVQESDGQPKRSRRFFGRSLRPGTPVRRRPVRTRSLSPSERVYAANAMVRWVPIAEAAKMTSFSIDTLLRERELGRLQMAKPTGRGWRIEISELEV